MNFANLGIALAVIAAPLVGLLIYRSVLTSHEDDQLFLDDAEAHMRREQSELIAKVGKLGPWINGLAAASGVVILAMCGLFVYEAITRVPQ